MYKKNIVELNKNKLKLMILKNDSKEYLEIKNTNLDSQIENFNQKSFYNIQNKIISNIFKTTNILMKKKNNYFIIKPEPILNLINSPKKKTLIQKKKNNFVKIIQIEKKLKTNFIKINNFPLFKEKSIYEKGFFKSQRKKRFKLKYYFDLCFLISQIFKGEIPSYNIFKSINKIHQNLFFSMILKKFENCFYLYEKNWFSNNQIKNKIKFEKICQLIESNKFAFSKKRKEENMKFVFNGIIKRLKVKFFQENKIDHPLKNSRKLFYEHYFKKTNNLFLFDNLSKSKKIIFNKKILKIYFISNLFKKDFNYFLKNFFKKIYVKNINKKFEFLFKKYEKHYHTHEKSSNAIFKNLKTKKQFKFPWTIYEVEESIKGFEIFLRNISL